MNMSSYPLQQLCPSYRHEIILPGYGCCGAPAGGAGTVAAGEAASGGGAEDGAAGDAVTTMTDKSYVRSLHILFAFLSI